MNFLYTIFFLIFILSPEILLNSGFLDINEYKSYALSILVGLIIFITQKIDYFDENKLNKKKIIWILIFIGIFIGRIFLTFSDNLVNNFIK